MTKQKGKDKYYSTKQQLVHKSTMKSELGKQYKTSDLTFTTLLQLYWDNLGSFLSPDDFLHLVMLNTTFSGDTRNYVAVDNSYLVSAGANTEL